MIRLGAICWFDTGVWPPEFLPPKRQLVRIVQVGLDDTSWMYMPVVAVVGCKGRITLNSSGPTDFSDDVYLRRLTQAELSEVFS